MNQLIELFQIKPTYNIIKVYMYDKYNEQQSKLT